MRISTMPYASVKTEIWIPAGRETGTIGCITPAARLLLWGKYLLREVVLPQTPSLAGSPALRADPAHFTTYEKFKHTCDTNFYKL
jgi:hypothetical protein